MQFPEDDEIYDAERELDQIDRDMNMMAERRHVVKRDLKRKQLDPAIAKMVELAQNAGHALGANEALGNRITFLEKRLAVRDVELERTSDRDEWKARAEAAELKLKRRRK